MVLALRVSQETLPGFVAGVVGTVIIIVLVVVGYSSR
jgi:hypothetical protein